MNPAQQSQPGDVYLLFAGFIDQLAVQRFFVATSLVAQSGNANIHLLMQTTGGNVADGVCLFSYFKSLPAHLTIYNVGSISSAGVLAYLGAPKRVVAPLATFMVHRSHATFQGANADAVQARIPSLIMDDKRSEAVLKERVHFTAEQWAAHKSADLWLDAEEAVSTGLATDIGAFGPPKGSQLFNVLG